MGRSISLKRMALQSLWGVGICAGLAVAAIFAVQIFYGMIGAPEPYIDVNQNRIESSAQAKASAAVHNKLRFAVATMVSAEETFSTYRQFVQRVATDIGREGAFVVRPSYEEERQALLHGQVDVALVCTGTYLRGLDGKSFKLLAQPEFTDGKEYRSLLLVPADSRILTWDDLQNKVMAFTDPESFTGCLLPSAELANRERDPANFFRKIIYTGSDDHSIIAVSTHVVDAAAVMSLVWLSTVEKQPSLAKQVRIIWQSPVFGPPLVVAPKQLDGRLEEELRQELLSLHKDEDGRKILAAIGIKRFVPVRPESYATAEELYRRHLKWQSNHD